MTLLPLLLPALRLTRRVAPQVSTQGAVSSNGGASLEWQPLPYSYLEQATGLFVAPLTTTYRFYLKANFQADVFLGSGPAPGTLTRVCSITYYSRLCVSLCPRVRVPACACAAVCLRPSVHAPASFCVCGIVYCVCMHVWGRLCVH